MRDSTTDQTFNQHQLTFRQLIVQLAHCIGLHQIPVQAQASDIHNFLGADAVHDALIKRVTQNVYRANCCGHLDAAVSPRATFAALGRIRGELSQCRRADIDQVNLLDTIGWVVRDVFANHHLIPAHDTATELADPQIPKRGQVISITEFTTGY